MKRITLTFMILLSVFFTIWGVKMKHPINRPENVKEDTETPWYETKYQAPKADDEWTLDPEIPLNYIPVPGEDELYMVVDDSGNITNYRKRVKQADGSWVWQDVNPDIPDNYEKVDGLDNVYKVTNKDGTTEYKQYVRNDDDTYCFVPVDEKGNPLDLKNDASTISKNYVHADGNIYALYNKDNVKMGYRERVKNNDGSYSWKVADPPKNSKIAGNGSGLVTKKNQNASSGSSNNSSGSDANKTLVGDSGNSSTTLTSIIGKIISVKLVGNGISLILVSNILSSYPSDSANIYEVLMKGKKTYIAGLHLFFLLILITALFIFTVWLQDTEKKIPVTYSGKLQGKSTFKGVSTNTIPIKLCPGGVVPIIFASSLISFPILIAQIAGAKQNAVLKLLNSGYWFNTSKPWYTFGALIYLVLIFAFSYFYTEITMNPEEIANNIKKSGGNIAGIRAGSSTAEYLRKQMKYLIAIGSFCLCIIAIIPFIVSGLTGLSRLSFFGTSIIITVSVILETKKLILSKTQENYYMNRVKKGGLFRG